MVAWVTTPLSSHHGGTEVTSCSHRAGRLSDPRDRAAGRGAGVSGGDSTGLRSPVAGDAGCPCSVARRARAQGGSIVCPPPSDSARPPDPARKGLTAPGRMGGRGGVEGSKALTPSLSSWCPRPGLAQPGPWGGVVRARGNPVGGVRPRSWAAASARAVRGRSPATRRPPAAGRATCPPSPPQTTAR